MATGTDFPSFNSSQSLWERYEQMNEYMYRTADPRTRDLPLCGRMDWMILLTIGYIIFVLIVPKLMRSRKPFEIRPLMLAYNTFLVGLSAWMFWTFLSNSLAGNYNYFCAPYKLSNIPTENKIVYAMWWYYVSKAIEFMDTVFMILKKKDNQVTFLHVYHHVVMFPTFYFTSMWAPSGQAVFCAMLNSFIHVLMYAYYGLAAFPALQKYLWWKRYLTQMQLAQFVAILVTTAYGIWTDCQYPKSLFYLNGGFMVTLIILFSNFYIQSYIKRKRDRSSHHSSQSRSHTNGGSKQHKKAE